MPAIHEAIVLVIEDDPLNATLAHKMLEIAGAAQVVVCKSGAEARQALAQLPQVSLVLLDLRLPEEDGYMILHSLRQYPQLQGVPIAATTANVMAYDVQKAEEAGFDGFLGKPFNFDRFPAQIRRLLDGERVWDPR